MIIPGPGELVVQLARVHPDDLQLTPLAVVNKIAGSGPDGWLVFTQEGRLLEVAEEPAMDIPHRMWRFIREYV